MTMTSKVLVLPSKEEIEKLKEDSEKFEHFFVLFQDWLRHQTHLPQNFNTSLLVLYLESCKLDLLKAQRKFEAFCYLPLTFEKIYGKRAATLESDLDMMNSMYIVSVPQLTPEGYRIGIIKPVNLETYDSVAMIRTVTVLVDFLLHNDFHTGQILVFDLQGVRPDMYGKLFTPVLFHMVKVVLEAYPARIKQIFITPCHPILEKGMNLIKILLPNKLKNRIYFLKNVEDLHQHISAKLLPSDYNGTQASLADLNEGWKHLLLENKDLFTKIEEMTPSGPMPKHVHKYDEDLGVSGSFRKLNID